MDKEERDEYVEKFRNKEINIVITTDLLSRGFDLPTIKLVINFDVPRRGQQVEYETYIHRIGRAGRFGDLGLAITLYDRDEDEEAFWDTIKHYQMQSKVRELEGPNQVAQLIDDIKKQSETY